MSYFASNAPEDTIAQINRTNRAIAQVIQARNPGWVVMWSVWRRSFSAFGCWTASRCVVVDAADAEELISEMQSIMIENWHRSRRHT
jgi:hypothetical protein